MKILRTKKSSPVLLLFVALLFSSCNEDFATKLNFQKELDTADAGKVRKVLYLIIDGARGESFNGTNTPAIAEMSRNAVLTYKGVSDANKLPETAWADMLTGVSKSKHGVVSQDFASNQLQQFPMFFKIIKDNNPGIRTAAFLSTDKISENLITASDRNEAFNGDDAAVKAAVVDELKREDAGVVLAEFSSVDKTGEQYGYDLSVNEYRQALSRVDAYIREMVKAVKERKSYENEDWLIIVASNKGGFYAPDHNDGSVFGDTERNSFLMFYNPGFSFRFFGEPSSDKLPYEGYYITLKDKSSASSSVYAEVPDDGGLYNFDSADDEFTIQFMIKVFSRTSRGISYAHASIFNKNSHAYSKVNGWQFMIEKSTKMRFVFLGSNKSLSYLYGDSEGVPLNKWVVYTVRVYKEGDERKASFYTDGVLNNTIDATGAYFGNSNAKLTLGIQSSSVASDVQYAMTNICIWNTALPDEFISTAYCRTEQLPGYRFYENLVGYWPVAEGEGDVIKNESPLAQGKDLLIRNNTYSWTGFNEVADNLCPPLPENIEEAVPRGIDVPIFLLSWLKLNTAKVITDGKIWMPLYTDVK